MVSAAHVWNLDLRRVRELIGDRVRCGSAVELLVEEWR